MRVRAIRLPHLRALLTPLRIRAIRDGLSVAGLLYAGLTWAELAHLGAPLGGDTRGYYFFDLSHVYAAGTGVLDAPIAFEYAPPFALLFSALHLLPWPVFRDLWLLLCALTLVWLGRSWTLVLLAFPGVVQELWYGNINLLLAAGVVASFRWPACWALPLLTKATPGVAVLWYAVRREWHSLTVAVAATAALVAASFAVAPSLWFDWIHLLAMDSAVKTPPLAISVPLTSRLIVALPLLLWGAHTNRRWTLPIVAMLALPVLWGAGLSVAAGSVPLLRQDRAAARAGAGMGQAGPRAEAP